MIDLDPIVELVRDLREHGKPSLAWTIRWSEKGEPVAGAWEASRDLDAMFGFAIEHKAKLRFAVEGRTYRVRPGQPARGSKPMTLEDLLQAQAAIKRVIYGLPEPIICLVALGVEFSGDAACETLRAAVIKVPTLTELIALNSGRGLVENRP